MREDDNKSLRKDSKTCNPFHNDSETENGEHVFSFAMHSSNPYFFFKMMDLVIQSEKKSTSLIVACDVVLENLVDGRNRFSLHNKVAH